MLLGKSSFSLLLQRPVHCSGPSVQCWGSQRPFTIDRYPIRVIFILAFGDGVIFRLPSVYESQKLFKNVVLPFKSLPKQLFGKFDFIFTFSKYFPEMLWLPVSWIRVGEIYIYIYIYIYLIFKKIKKSKFIFFERCFDYRG